MITRPIGITLCIVIPCYNEAKKFLSTEYEGFLKKETTTLICFVNDGSKDNTMDVLTGIGKRFPDQVEIVSYEKNQGKATAVRRGILHCLGKFDFKYVAYLDADLAVSLQECCSLTKYLNDEIHFCFGSRILKIGSIIERKRSRFLIGRLLATVISELLSLKVYDTQCGCKLFTKELATQLFAAPFISKWLFDVEIFFRMLELYGKEEALSKMLEVPLVQWKDNGDSKVKFSYFFKLFLDLYKIRRKYKYALSKKSLTSLSPP